MSTKRKKIEINPLAIIIVVCLVIYMVAMLVMLGWTLITTIKLPDEYNGLGYDKNILWLPKEKWAIKNYYEAYKEFYVTADIFNSNYEYVDEKDYGVLFQFLFSLLYSFGCATTVTLASLVMGYATARYNYKFSQVIYAFVLITMALPIVGSMPSEIAVATDLKLFNTFHGIWIMRGNFLNTYFLIFYAQFKMIPKDYTEAAKIDGANPFSIMTQIIVPLAAGTTSAVFVLAFIGYWNDFQIPMVYLPSYPVAAFGMYEFLNNPAEAIANVPTQLAGIIMLALPIIVFYAIFNKKMNVNLSVGGIKG